MTFQDSPYSPYNAKKKASIEVEEKKGDNQKNLEIKTEKYVGEKRGDIEDRLNFCSERKGHFSGDCRTRQKGHRDCKTGGETEITRLGRGSRLQD